MIRKLRIPLWIAVLLWMALIFSFSMEDGVESAASSGGLIRRLLETLSHDFLSLDSAGQTAAIESWSNLVRKTAHFCIFGMLGLLVTSAVSSCGLCFRKNAWISLGICAAYAVSDEIHQAFVPGRACMVRDMLLDTCGAACGIAVVSLLIYAANKHQSKKHTKHSCSTQT